MADTTALKNRIRAAIKANDNQEITGPVLQQALLDMVDELNGATETEAEARQSGDSTLQQGINTERQARIDADNALGQRITQETQRAQEAEQTANTKASKALSEITSLEIEDITGSVAQATEMSIALRTNEGSAENPEIVTLDTLVLPSASEQKAGLLNATDKKSINSQEVQLNIFSISGYINHSGNISSDTVWHSTDFIDINDIIVKRLTLYNILNLTTCIAFYNANKEFISNGSITANGKYHEDDYVVPQNAVYVRFCKDSREADNFVTIFAGLNPDYAVSITKNTQDIAKNTQDIAKNTQDIAKNIAKQKNDMFYPFTGYINHSGNISSDTRWRSTDFIKISCLKIKTLWLHNIFNLTTCIAFYNANKEFISNGSITANGTYHEDDYVVPQNAVYVRFCKEDNTSLFVDALLLSGYLTENMNAYFLLDFPIKKHYINHEGNLIDNDYWETTHLLKVNEVSILHLQLENVNNRACIAFYDINKNFVSDGSIIANGDYDESAYVVPQDAVYVRFCRDSREVTPTRRYVYVKHSSAENDDSTLTSDNIYPAFNEGYTTDVYHQDGTTGHYSSWAISRIMPIPKGGVLFGNTEGYNSGGIAIPDIVYFDENQDFCGASSPVHGTHDVMIDLQYPSVPENAKYFAVQVLNYSENNNSKKQFFINFKGNIVYENLLNNTDARDTAIQLVQISSLKIYNAGNDFQRFKQGFPRNYSAVLYLDCFLPKQNITEEPNIRFDNGLIAKAIPCYEPPMRQIQGLDNSWETPLMNNDQALHTENIVLKIKDTKKNSSIKQYTVINRSVLNSKNNLSNKKISILCIGDSVTFGQNAFFVGNANKANYTLLLQEFFKKDSLQSENGYTIETIGTIKHQRNFSYQGNTYSLDAFNEGYSGTTLQNTGLFKNPKFLDANNNFSFQNWLDKYRTKDDNGNQLYFDAQGATTGVGGNYGYYSDGALSEYRIGTKVTDVLAYNVYKPTHVFLFHGSNQAVTKNDYDSFISYVRAVFPDSIIGLGTPHTAGTYFPSEFKEYVNSERWNEMIDFGYINRQYATQQALNSIDADASYEQNNVFVIPTFFVNPAAKAIPEMEVSEPFRDFEDGESLYEPKGQSPDVHVGGKAHAAYAYQLYSWIKWTIANNLL